MYKLRRPTMGIIKGDGKPAIVSMPKDALLNVNSENFPDGTVEVVWNGQKISMFAIDLEERGELVAVAAHRSQLINK
jgi:hypothetical protein